MQRSANIFAQIALWLCFLLMPLLAHAGGLGIAPIAFILGLAGLAYGLASRAIEFKRDWLWLIPFLAFLIWANITALWSPYEASGLTNAHKILIMGLVFAFAPMTISALKADKKDTFSHVFMAGSVLAIGLMTLDVVSGWGLSILVDPVKDGQSLSDRQSDALMNVGHGFFTYVQYTPIIFALFFAYLKKSLAWVMVALFAAVSAFGAYANLLNIGPVALLVVSAVMIMAYFLPRLTTGLALIGFTALIMGAPLVGMLSERFLESSAAMPFESWEHRLRMWAYSWGEIQNHPWIGNGFDASRSYSDTYTAKAGYDIAIISLHPHNIGTQIWLEIGAIGAALISAAILGLWKPAMRYSQTPLRAAALAGTITAIAIIGATTIGVWQFWWWGSIAFALMCLHLIPADTAAS